MIPYRDINPTRRVPVINYMLLLANSLVFIYELFLGPRVESFINAWGVRASDVSALLGGNFAFLPIVLQTVLVSMFLHGGWAHIFSNMLFLWVFGDNVEDNFGSGQYLLFYLLCGYGAAVGQAFLTPMSDAPAIGASGAISGVLAAYLLLYPRAAVRAVLPILLFLPVSVPAWAMITVWFALQLLNGIASVSQTALMTGGVAYGAHVGGFVMGLLLVFVLRKPDRTPRYVPGGAGYRR